MMSRRGHERPLFDNTGEPTLFSAGDVQPPAATETGLLSRISAQPNTDYGTRLDPRRNAFIEKFRLSNGQLAWLPYSRREVTIALTGLDSVINQAANARVNRGRSLEDRLKPAKKTYKEARGYFDSSKDALSSLHKIARPTDEDVEPAYELIWTDEAVKALIAGHVIAHAKLDSFSWERSGSPLIVAATEQIQDQIRLCGRGEATGLWTAVRDAHRRRLHFWGSQLHSVTRNRYVLALAADPENDVRL